LQEVVAWPGLDLAHQVICTHTGVSNSDFFGGACPYEPAPRIPHYLLLLLFFITLFLPLPLPIALRTPTITTKDERRWINGNTPLLYILVLSCLPWLTVTLSHHSSNSTLDLATTMTTTITTTTMIMTARPLLYIAHKGCF
jgi:hypothetical protein